LILNFCVWIVPSYLYLFPAPITTEVQSFFEPLGFFGPF